MVATGTFLKAQIHIGLSVRNAGRLGDGSSIGKLNSLNIIKFLT